MILEKIIKCEYNCKPTSIRRSGGIQDDGLWYFIPNDDSKQSATEILNNNLQN